MEILNPRTSRIAKKRRFHLSVQHSGLEKLYPSPLTLYTDPPTDVITLQNLDELAVERLQLLRAVERAGTQGDWEKSLQSEVAKSENLRPYLKLETPANPEQLESVLEARRRDYLSHFVLRLAYCRSDSLRWWFINQESEVFKFKLTRASAEDKRMFLKHCDLKFTDVVSNEEKKERLQQLAEGTASLLGTGNLYSTAEKTNFYRVPFQDAIELVKSRRAYLESGVVYVAETDMNTIIIQIFKARLNHSLALAGHMLPTWEKDERLRPLVSNFHNTYVGPEYDKVRKSGAKVSLENIHQLAEESFPMCMKHLYDVLKTQHHLKHFSRVQFNLFLKGIGLPMENALQLFRSEFVKGATEPEKFDKKYAYSFRHGYGKEGKRADYRPFSCLKIIQQTPGPQETHGCPFAHFDVNSLRVKLKSMKIGEAGIQDILELNKNKHHQIACGKVFQFTHGLPTNSVGINHPNQYFENSYQLRHGETPADMMGVKKEENVEKPVAKAESAPPPKDDWEEDMDVDEAALAALGV